MRHKRFLARMLGGILAFASIFGVYKFSNYYPTDIETLYKKYIYKALEEKVPDKDVDICFIQAYHNGPQSIENPEEKYDLWFKNYPNVASKHTDSDGCNPRFSWFYRLQEPKELTLEKTPELETKFLNGLNEMVFNGFGEIELHIHHDFRPNDPSKEKDATKEMFRLIEERKRILSNYGALITAEREPKKVFAFIHGDWALDNSYDEYGEADRRYCGVNLELKLLGETGCFADFTFPSPWPTDPRTKDNSIFYARDDPRPKSYDYPENQRDVEVGKPPFGDLMIFEGPYMKACLGDIMGKKASEGLIERAQTKEFYLNFIQDWISSHVHVRGKPEWLFIKTHAHSISSLDNGVAPIIFFGEGAELLYSQLEDLFKNKKMPNGRMARLHYLTTREAYNTVKAAEGGKSGDVGQFRDFLIPQYANRRILSNLPYSLLTFTPQKVIINIGAERKYPLRLKLRSFNLNTVVEESADGQIWVSSDVHQKYEDNVLVIEDDTISGFYRIRITRY